MQIIGTGSGQISKTQLNGWQKNLVVFLIPVALLYLTAKIGVLQLPNHEFSFHDLELTPFILGGMVLYVMNGVLDILRKFLSDNKP